VEPFVVTAPSIRRVDLVLPPEVIVVEAIPLPMSRFIRPTVGNRCGIQYLVVNAAARRHAGVKAGDVVTIILEPDTEKRDIEIPIQLRRALGAKLTEKLNRLSFSHKKEFVVWYSDAKKEHTRARRVGKMKAMLSEGKVIS
jgi:bifunctional DNA-binding transcriptional regulator/antitoxin component of YhaV-PrlF toxin-antitoxin module